MPLSTDLSRPPYYDAYKASSDYYRILFQPGVSVQTRELNELQSLFQKQLERFGDNIFATGTIVSGCNFGYYNPYPYVKIKDLDILGNIVIPSSYVSLNVKNEVSGLRAIITNFAEGFESTDPELKTLYVSYNNTGDANDLTFASGDTLTIYDPVMNGVEKVNVINGGITFSNTDRVIALSAIIVTVNGGTISDGDYLINGLGANVQIVTHDSATLAKNNQVIVNIKPKATDLANSLANSQSWTLSLNQSVTNPANTLHVTINQIIGAGFNGNIITDGVGSIIDVNVVSKGVGYTTVPYITLQSFGNVTGYASLNLQAQNYVNKVFVSTTAGAVGNGYAFGVTEGVIYQKGYFLRVIPQQIVIKRYDQMPDNVAVGFVTNEQVINYNIDQTLLDNVQGTLNEQAPGADRLKLVPFLRAVSHADAASNAEFLTIAEWKEGQPYRQNQSTIYSVIGDEMARRTNDASGSFVIDPFLVTTRSPAFANQEGNTFNIVIDPGIAYIEGYRVATSANFNIDDDKGIDTAIVNNHVVSLNYGNYIRISNVAGIFAFNTGDTVNLYDTYSDFYKHPTSLNPVGSKIGTARLRNMVRTTVSGTYPYGGGGGGPPGASAAGTPGTTTDYYRLYLFDIEMNAGKNFGDARSVSYGANAGVADIIVNDVIPSTTTRTAQLIASNSSQLVFYSGVESLKNANNVLYKYRTLDQNVLISNGNVTNAVLIKDVTSLAPEVFPYSGTLSSRQMLDDLYVVPTGGDMVYMNTVAGTIAVNTTSAIGNGTTSTWLTTLAAGDWVYVAANSIGGHDLKQVTSVANNTQIYFNSNVSFVNATATLTRVFPNAIPIPFGGRTGLTGNVNVSGAVLTLDFGTSFAFSGTKSAALGCNILRNNPTNLTKTPNRNVFVKIVASNNAGNTVGPWCLGVPDAFRLRSVFIGNSTISNTETNYVSNFYIDHNQSTDAYGLSYLYKKPKSGLSISSSQHILVEFDYFTASGAAGYFDAVSYRQTADLDTIFLQDAQPLSNLSSVVNSFEIPELFSRSGEELDLIQYFDFRPRAANTVNPSMVYGTAPLNPNSTFTLDTTTEKKFPAPDSTFTTTIEYFMGRKDSVFLNKNGQFIVGRGTPNTDIKLQELPTQPDNTMRLVDMIVPSYPTLPINPSVNLAKILDTGTQRGSYTTTRKTQKTISNLSATSRIPYKQPRVYTMSDIGKIDRRLHDAEYYITLAVLEAGVANKFIPSSIDPSLDRFKFGIFVDDFSTSNFSDLSNPQYAASKEDVNIVPSKILWDNSLFGFGSADWIDTIIVSQNIATVGSITDPLGLGPICALNLANTVAYQLKFRNASDVELSSNPTSPIDDVYLKFADQTSVIENIQLVTAPVEEWIQNNQYSAYTLFNEHNAEHWTALEGPNQLVRMMGLFGGIGSYTYDPASATLTVTFADADQVKFSISGMSQEVATAFAYAFGGFITWQQFFSQLAGAVKAPAGGSFVSQIYIPPAVLYFYNYAGLVRYEIFQNGVLIASSDGTVPGVYHPSSLTQAEITLLTGPSAQNWFNDYTEFFMLTYADAGAGYLAYAGKIAFNYDPRNGSDIVIRASMSSGATRWRYVVAYPINGASVGCVPPPTPTLSVTGTLNPIFNTFTYNAWCGNGFASWGQINILTGFTETWNPVIPAPTVSILPFDISSEWRQA